MVFYQYMRLTRMLANKKDREDYMMVFNRIWCWDGCWHIGKTEKTTWCFQQNRKLSLFSLAWRTSEAYTKCPLKQNRRPAGLLLTGEEDREDYGVSSRPDRGWGGGPPPPSPRHLGGGRLQGHAYRRLSGGLPPGFETRGFRSSQSTGLCSFALRN